MCDCWTRKTRVLSCSFLRTIATYVACVAADDRLEELTTLAKSVDNQYLNSTQALSSWIDVLFKEDEMSYTACGELIDACPVDLDVDPLSPLHTNDITVVTSRNEPSVTFQGAGHPAYTMIFVDVGTGALNSSGATNYLHWAVTDIPVDPVSLQADVSRGNAVIPYFQPGNPVCNLPYIHKPHSTCMFLSILSSS